MRIFIQEPNDLNRLMYLINNLYYVIGWMDRSSYRVDDTCYEPSTDIEL